MMTQNQNLLLGEIPQLSDEDMREVMFGACKNILDRQTLIPETPLSGITSFIEGVGDVVRARRTAMVTGRPDIIEEGTPSYIRSLFANQLA